MPNVAPFGFDQSMDHALAASVATQVPLQLEQMCRAVCSSNLLFINSEGVYEVEGALEELSLPTSVRLLMSEVFQLWSLLVLQYCNVMSRCLALPIGDGELCGLK